MSDEIEITDVQYTREIGNSEIVREFNDRLRSFRDQTNAILRNALARINRLEALMSIEEQTFSYKNGQTYPLGNAAFSVGLVSFAAREVDAGAVTVEFLVDGVNVPTTPTTPFAIPAGGDLYAFSVDDYQVSPGEQLQIRTTGGTNGNSIFVAYRFELTTIIT